MHDPEVYDDPPVFRPERFLKRTGPGKFDYALNPSVRDPVKIAFDWERRACPGQHIAYDSMWFAVASVLATFNIEKACDKYGNPITPPEVLGYGFVV